MAESKKRTGKRKRSDEWDPEEGKLMNDPHGPGRQPKAETDENHTHGCKHCHKAFFTSPSHCNRHMNTCKMRPMLGKRKMFECPQCPKSFTRMDNMQAHRRRHHSGGPTGQTGSSEVIVQGPSRPRKQRKPSHIVAPYSDAMTGAFPNDGNSRVQNSNTSVEPTLPLTTPTASIVSSTPNHQSNEVAPAVDSVPPATEYAPNAPLSYMRPPETAGGTLPLSDPRDHRFLDNRVESETYPAGSGYHHYGPARDTSHFAVQSSYNLPVAHPSVAQFEFNHNHHVLLQRYLLDGAESSFGQVDRGNDDATTTGTTSPYISHDMLHQEYPSPDISNTSNTPVLQQREAAATKDNDASDAIFLWGQIYWPYLNDPAWHLPASDTPQTSPRLL